MRRSVVLVLCYLLKFDVVDSRVLAAFVSIADASIRRRTSPSHTGGLLIAKAKKKKKRVATAGIKGFGGTGTSSSSNSDKAGVTMDRSKATLRFYDYMERNDAGDNLKRSALGYFPSSLMDSGVRLRGVVARKDMKKGDVLIRIPYELAVNLGPEGEDPTLPAVTLLRDYCQALQPVDTTSTTSNSGGVSGRKSYFEMLPPFRGDDCMGSTDFFSDDALDALQAPMVKEETLQRRARTKARFEQDIGSDSNFPFWIDGTTSVTSEHLQWAVWLITSRVLTVQGDANERSSSYRLLIPFLDMCNHDRTSTHVLTGRAVPGGELKVVAGGTVREGEQINICYGGGVAGNDRFLQDYGFLDDNDGTIVGYDLVAQQLLGKRRIVEGPKMSVADSETTLETLRSTTIQQDEQALVEMPQDRAMQSAISYRLGVKKALSKYILME